MQLNQIQLPVILWFTPVLSPLRHVKQSSMYIHAKPTQVIFIDFI